MPSEVQVLTWLYQNWPSAVLGLSAGITYVALYLRLLTFLARVEKMEKEAVRQARELVHVKIKLAQMVLNHCQKYPSEMPELMKIAESEDL